MIVLLVAVLLAPAFGLIVRYAQEKGCNLWTVGAINYVTASLFHVVRCMIGGGLRPSPATLGIGILGGVAYITSFFLLFPAMKLRGVSIATAVLRLAAVVPIVLSIVLWGEHPTEYQAVGAALAFTSLPLLTFKPGKAVGSLGRRSIRLLIALFFVNGLCSLAPTAYRHAGIRGEDSLYLAILFGTAAVIGQVAWFFHREGASTKDIPFGVGLGLCNALGNLALIAALQQFPSVLVFPIIAVVGLVFVAVFARVVWGERINRYERMGMLVALGAVVLINVG